MKRERRYQEMACAVCGAVVQAGAEAARVLCQTCAASGRDFPRSRQLDLFESLRAPDEAPAVPVREAPGGAG